MGDVLWLWCWMFIIAVVSAGIYELWRARKTTKTVEREPFDWEKERIFE